MKAIYGAIFVLSSFLPLQAMADSQCGDFKIHWSNDGWARVNGAKPESQKVTFLKDKGDYNNVKIEWRMATDQPGRWVGLEFIGREGKAFLNAQWLRASMDAPSEFATYDCVKVGGK
ncbi:TPA: hypothetical protein ACSTJX_003880 [Serratia fonticola]